MNVTLVNGINDSQMWNEYQKSILVLKEELVQKGYKVDYFPIAEMNLHYCQGCWDCWTKTPGLCRLKDGGEEYLKALKDTDCLIYFSPVKAGFITKETKKALDRFIPNALPFISIYEKECHHLERYPYREKILGVVLLDDGSFTAKTSDIIFGNFDRIQKNMKIKKSIRFKLSLDNREELLNEIISN